MRTRAALEICHFDPATGKDLAAEPENDVECEAACYECLMSYSNQQDHELLDRASIKDYLLSLTTGTLHQSASADLRAGNHVHRKRCHTDVRLLHHQHGHGAVRSRQ